MRTDVAVGDRVYRAMGSQRITQVDLAKRLGVAQSTLSKKLRGERPWSVDELVRVSDALGVKPSKLLPSAADRQPDSLTVADVLGHHKSNRSPFVIEMAMRTALFRAVSDDSASGHDEAVGALEIIAAREKAWTAMGRWNGGEQDGGLTHPEYEQWAARHAHSLYERYVESKQEKPMAPSEDEAIATVSTSVRPEGFEPPTF